MLAYNAISSLAGAAEPTGPGRRLLRLDLTDNRVADLAELRHLSTFVALQEVPPADRCCPLAPRPHFAADEA